MQAMWWWKGEPEAGLWGGRGGAAGKDSEGPWPLSPAFLSEFPAHLLSLTALETLSLSSRGLSSIPDAISRLTRLTSLQVRYSTLRLVITRFLLLVREEGVDACKWKLLSWERYWG